MYPDPEHPLPVHEKYWSRILAAIRRAGCEVVDIEKLRGDVGFALARYEALFRTIESLERPAALMSKADARAKLIELESRTTRFADFVESIDREIADRVSHEITRPLGTGENPRSILFELVHTLGAEGDLLDRLRSAARDWRLIAESARRAIARVDAERKAPSSRDVAAIELGVWARQIWRWHTRLDPKRGRDRSSPFDDFLGAVRDAAGIEMTVESLSKASAEAEEADGKAS